MALEKEVKILDIDEKDILNKLSIIGAIDKGIKHQKLYTYDIPTLDYRYKEAVELMNSSNNLLVNTSISKLKQVLFEYQDLESDNQLTKIYENMGIKQFSELFEKGDKEIIDIINKCKILSKSISKFKINPNKWIRLRQSNDEVELTVKNIYNKSDSKIQKVMEYEISTNSFEDTNMLLESIGLIRRNYQEKTRHSFVYKNAKIEIDKWPLINPYLEIESDDEKLFDEIINLLGLEEYRVVSINTTEVYKKYGIDVLKIPELRFKNDNNLIKKKQV